MIQEHKIDRDEQTKLANNACIRSLYIATAWFESKYTKLLDEGLEVWNAVMLDWVDIRFGKISKNYLENH